jgi:hypothetical protein
LAISSHKKTPFSHQSSCPKPASAPWQVSPQTKRAPLHF